MIKKLRKNEFNFELVFKVIYLLLVFISFNPFFAHKPFISYISYAVVCYGIAVILLRLTHFKDYLNISVWLLMAFVMSYIISSLTVIRYGWLENAQAVVWMCLMFFVIFAYDKTRSNEVELKEFNIISGIVVGYTFISAVASIIMLITKYSLYRLVDGKYIIGGGFLWNRLYGCYIDPNYGAIFAIISIFLSFYFIREVLGKSRLKYLLFANILFEYLYICFSDSRTGQVALFVSVGVFVFLAVYRKTVATTTKKVALSLVLAILVSIVVVGSTIVVKTSISKLQVFISYSSAIDNGLSAEDAEAIADIDRIGREDEEINDGDLSNNRFSIWASAIDIFKEHPIVGISFRNIMEFSDDEQPEGFISQSGFESMHNTFVDVLVSQGIVGMVLLILLIVSILYMIIKRTKLLGPFSLRLFGYELTIVLAIFSCMMFYSETFYMNTAGAFIFWFMLGKITKGQSVKEI